MSQPLPTALRRRDQVAGALFGIWIVGALYLDGWAHNAEKPETFFTPWHAVLYAGIGAAITWFAIQDSRRRAAGIVIEPPAALRAALALVVVGGVGDMIWHEIFGIEEDIEALLSPTHLALMTGGMLFISQPIRLALEDHEPAPVLRRFLPTAVCVALVMAMVSFFLQFSSAFHLEDQAFFGGDVPDETQIHGVVAILLTNALFLGTAAWVLRRWRPPAGALTVIFGVLALLMSSQSGFDDIALVITALAGGVAADALVARRWPTMLILAVVPVILWTTWFATYDAVWGLGWTVELWTGTIAFAVLSGVGLALLTAPSGPRLTPQVEGGRQTQNSLPSGSLMTTQHQPRSS